MSTGIPRIIKRKPNSFSHYDGRAIEKTREKWHLRGKKGTKTGYLLIPSCEGWVRGRGSSDASPLPDYGMAA
jgi:hypothetical protein